MLDLWVICLGQLQKEYSKVNYVFIFASEIYTFIFSLVI